MDIPVSLQAIIDRLKQELHEIETSTQHGLEILKQLLEMFPNNDILVQFYSYLSNALFLVDIYQKRLEMNKKLILETTTDEEIVKNVAEELGDLLGRTIESRIGVELIVNRLEKLV
jgi:predicted transcriptional regulator